MAHIAGGARLSLNLRGADADRAVDVSRSPRSRSADRRSAIRSAASAKGCSTTNARAATSRRCSSRTRQSNTGAAAVRRRSFTPAPDGKSDLPLPDNVRAFFLTGAQHGPARFPTKVESGTAARQSARVRVDAARVARRDDEVGEGRRGAAGESDSAARGRHARPGRRR